METVYENSASVRTNEFYKINNSTSKVSKEFNDKGNELLKYISTNLFSEKNIDIPEIDEVQSHCNKSISVYKINTNTTIKNSIFILNEEFIIEKESGMIIVGHPIWSLAGQGKTLYEAIKNMTEFAFEVYKSMADDKPSDLTIEANNLRDFLFKVF